MKCRDLQFILPLYSDSVLSEEEQSHAELHLDTCPVCRQILADFNEMRNNLRSIARPRVPTAAVNVLRQQISLRLEGGRNQMFQSIGDRRRWMDVWLMPFAVGSLSSLVIAFTLLWVVISNEIRPTSARKTSQASVSNTTLLYPASRPLSIESDLNPFEYASSRAGFSQESPSINPHGSLVALTSSLAHEIDADEELTVIADVYGNGSASITEVVEATSDNQAVNELQRALDSRSASAFVPASFDHRSEPMRVVLKIQNVSVRTDLR